MSRLRALFQRYADRHFQMQQPGCPLPGPGGHLDSILYKGRGVVLEGWTEAESVVVRSDGETRAGRPNLLRRDVEDATGLRPDVGFRLDLPEVSQDIELALSSGGQSWTMRLPDPSAWQLRKQRWVMRLRFARDLLRAAPALLPALLTGDPRSRARVKAYLGLDQDDLPGSVLETRLFDCAGLTQGPSCTPITIILPVYQCLRDAAGCPGAACRAYGPPMASCPDR